MPYMMDFVQHQRRSAGESARVQMAGHKVPAGPMVLSWPGAWGVTMAAFSLSLPFRELSKLLAIFFFGSAVVHSTACSMNGMCDVNVDRQVEHTQTRPLAKGRVSLPPAWAFCLLQVALFVGLLSQTNEAAFLLGLFALCPLHAIYPFMKRITYWPQAWIGLAMNWGVIVGWVLLVEHVDWVLLAILLSGCLCWTIVYDNIYACPDKGDDAKAEVKSNGLLFGFSIKAVLTVFSTVFICTLSLAGLRNQQGPAFFVVGIGGSSALLTWQLVNLDADNAAGCWRKFLVNGKLGVIVWLGMVIDYAMKQLP